MKRKWIARSAGVLAALLLLTGCRAKTAFDGSMTSNENGFHLSYAILDQEQTADLALAQGDRLEVRLAHTGGEVNVTVGQPGKEPIYTGTRQTNAAFTLVIPESGDYRISLLGRRASGQADFTRVTDDEKQ